MVLNQLLKKNQTDCHIYFSDRGAFHNHRAHNLLAAYALGATPSEWQSVYDFLESLTKPRHPIDRIVIAKMHNQEGFESMLGDDRHFHNFLAFFVEKIDKDGWKNVLNEYLSSKTKIAEELFARIFAG